MGNSENNKIKMIIKSVLTGVIATTVFVFAFAAVMYFAGLDKIYSVIFATVSVAFGCFAAAYNAARENKSKGFLIGTVVGLVVFFVITLISLIADKGAVGINTLFHFIIFMISAIVGGVMGVNKADSKKYIK